MEDKFRSVPPYAVEPIAAANAPYAGGASYAPAAGVAPAGYREKERVGPMASPGRERFREGLWLGPHSGARPAGSAAAVSPLPVDPTMLEFTRTLAAGIPPSNDLLIRVITHAERLLSSRDFNPFDRTTARIASDIQHLLESARRIVAERNRGEPLQEVLYHGVKGTTEVAPQVGDKAARLREKAQQRLPGSALASPSDAYNKARQLIVEYMRSAEFREIGMELFKVVQQLINVRGKLVTEQTGNEEVIVETVTTTTRTEYDQLGRPIQTQITSRNAELMPAKAAATLDNVVNRESVSGIPSAQFSGLQSDDESQRAELRARLRGILGRIARHDAMRQAFLNTLLFLGEIEELGIGDTGASVAKNESLQRAMTNARALIEQFTGGRSMTNVISAFSSIMRMLRQDRDLRAFFSDSHAYLIEVMKNPSLADDDERLITLLKRGRRFMEDQRFSDYTSTFFTESRLLMAAVRADPVASQFSQDLRRLLQDLFLDSNGSPTLKTEALRGLKNVVVALMMDEMKSLPLPPISGGDANLQFSLSNIALTFFDLLPEDIEIKNKVNTHVHPTNISMPASNWSDSKGKFKIVVRKLPTRIENVDYWFRKSTGYKIEDRGRMWIDLSRGVKLVLHVNAYYGEKYPHFFKVKTIRCKIERLKFGFTQTEHRALLGFLKPFMNGTIRKAAERGIEEKIAKSVATLERTLHEWLMRVPLPETVENRFDRQSAVRYVDKLVPVLEDNYGSRFGADQYHPGGVNQVNRLYGAPYAGQAGAYPQQGAVPVAGGPGYGYGSNQYAQAAQGIVYGREAIRH